MWGDDVCGDMMCEGEMMCVGDMMYVDMMCVGI